MDIKELINDARRRMDSAVEDARKKLAAVRTGRARSTCSTTSGGVYGAQMPLNQVATIHAPEPISSRSSRLIPLRSADREGHTRQRAWAQPFKRRQADPGPYPAAHRGAPKPDGEGGPRDSRRAPPRYATYAATPTTTSSGCSRIKPSRKTSRKTR